jgi:signal transduction histidine kinase
VQDEQNLRKVVHPDDIPGMWKAIQAACDPASDGRYHAEYRVVRPDGGWRWLSVCGIVEFEVTDVGRKPVRMIGASRDIDHQKQILESLYQAKAAAEKANRAKDNFLAVLSHELRTPLNPALMAATILERDPRLGDDVREEAAVIRRNIELEARLIDDLLDLTRIAHGKVSLARR